MSDDLDLNVDENDLTVNSGDYNKQKETKNNNNHSTPPSKSPPPSTPPLKSPKKNNHVTINNDNNEEKGGGGEEKNVGGNKRIMRSRADRKSRMDINEITDTDELIDQDPTERVYNDKPAGNKGEITHQAALIIGSIIKELILSYNPRLKDGGGMNKDEEIEFIIDFLERLKETRTADPTMDLEKLIQTQSKIMHAAASGNNHHHKQSIPDFPDGLLILPDLQLFAKEFIRYSPSDVFGFSLDYFRALNHGSDEIKLFRQRMAKEYEPKWRAYNALKLKQKLATKK